MRVYLVESSPLVRERLRRVLAQHAPIQVVGCCDGASEAARHAPHLRPDLIILDLSLREGNGFQLLAAIAQWPQRPEVIVLTNDTQEPFRLAADRLGARLFFDKALEFEQAMDAVGLMSTRWSLCQDAGARLEA